MIILFENDAKLSVSFFFIHLAIYIGHNFNNTIIIINKKYILKYDEVSYKKGQGSWIPICWRSAKSRSRTNSGMAKKSILVRSSFLFP